MTAPVSALKFQISSLAVKDMAHTAGEGEIQLVASVEGVDVLALGIHGGDDDHHVLAARVGVEVDLAAHHLADLHGGGEGITRLLGEHHVAGPDAQGDVLGRHAVGRQVRLLLLRELHRAAADGHGVLSALVFQLRVEEVHLGHADEAGHKEIGGVVEDLLGRADLLDEAVLHDDDPVAQGHGLRLVVGHVHKCRVDLLPELDDLRPHLVTELGVQVGEGFVHEEHFRLPDDGPADGNALALAAGEGLGLAV